MAYGTCIMDILVYGPSNLVMISIEINAIIY